MNKIERIGEVLQSLNDLKGLINLNSFLARDLGLNLLSVLLLLVKGLIFEKLAKVGYFWILQNSRAQII